MLKHVKPRKALQFDCDLSMVREEGDQMVNEMIDGDQMINATSLLQDDDQLHLTLDLQIVEQEMEAPLVTDNLAGQEDDDDSILTNPPTILSEDEELDDGVSEPSFNRLFIGKRLVEMQKEELVEKEASAPLRGAVVESRQSLVAAWVENGGRRGFSRSHRVLGADASGGKRCLLIFLCSMLTKALGAL